MANARCIKAAQVQPHGVGVGPVPSGTAPSGVEAVGSAATASKEVLPRLREDGSVPAGS